MQADKMRKEKSPRNNHKIHSNIINSSEGKHDLQGGAEMFVHAHYIVGGI